MNQNKVIVGVLKLDVAVLDFISFLAGKRLPYKLRRRIYNEVMENTHGNFIKGYVTVYYLNDEISYSKRNWAYDDGHTVNTVRSTYVYTLFNTYPELAAKAKLLGISK